MPARTRTNVPITSPKYVQPPLTNPLTPRAPQPRVITPPNRPIPHETPEPTGVSSRRFVNRYPSMHRRGFGKSGFPGSDKQYIQPRTRPAPAPKAAPEVPAAPELLSSSKNATGDVNPYEDASTDSPFTSILSNPILLILIGIGVYLFVKKG